MSMEFNSEEILKYFHSEQGLSSVIDGFRQREEQLRLAQAVIEALTNSEFLLAEVGTGVGKTFAYLLPAIFWSLYTGERVVVATRTKALQKQISEKDMPDANRLLKAHFSWAEAKGRDNYLCWSKYIGVLSGRRSLNDNESQFITSILSWAESTSSGDRQELNINSSLMQNWGLISADRHTCLRDRCSFREKCFRLKMLKRLEQANIIITNHALLLSDLMIDNQIIPEYQYLIVDEAHNLDREAFDKLSSVFSSVDTFEILNMLGTYSTRREGGFLQSVRKSYPEMEPAVRELELQLDKTRETTKCFFAQLAKIGSDGMQHSYSLVIDEETYEKFEFAELSAIHLEWQEQIHLLLSGLKELKENLSGRSEEADLITFTTLLQSTADAAFHIMEENVNRQDFMHWVDYFDGMPVSISSSSVGMSELLYERLFAKLQSVVLVSATLTVNRNFTYAIDHLGLQPIAEQERLNTLLEDSPFIYDKQACLLCVTDMPEPESSGFTAQAAAAIISVADTVGGSTMALFTSRQQLADVSQMIRTAIEEKGINLLVQNEDGDFNALLTRFTRSRKSILMGLDTFWEGIDLKGELLRCLIVVKLPFRPPNEPFTSACLKDCQIRGKNGFQNFSLPDATVRFKQGIGRLIRSEEDFGIVVMLDPRLVGKSYGRIFRASIPIQNIQIVKRRELNNEMVFWLGHRLETE